MRMISLLLLLVMLLPAQAEKLQAREPRQAPISDQTDSAWIVNNYQKWERLIPMRDGKRLFTSIYLPKDSSRRHPVLLWRTPYSCAPYGDSAFRPFWSNQYRRYLKEGYIMVIQDVRGRYMSEGDFVDIRPHIADKGPGDIDESTDSYDTVDWLVKNIPGNNGRVGVYGISYPGFYAGQAALSGHSAVVAVSPQAPVTDWFAGDDFHHNGAFMQLDAFGFYVLYGFGMPRQVPAPERIMPAYKPFTKDMYEFFLRMGSIPAQTRAAGDSLIFWNQMMRHPDLDSFWKARDARRHMKDLKPAVLVVGGLFDAEDCFGGWNLYRAIEAQSPGTDNRLVVGPWYHGQWAEFDGNALGDISFGSNTSDWYFDRVEFPFFQYHLQGVGSPDQLAEATVFFSGEHRWRTYDSWPPRSIQEKPMYLLPGGRLSWSPADKKGGYTAYTSDPDKPVPYTGGVHDHRTREYMIEDQRFAASRPDVLVFQTGPLEETITLAGPLTAELQVSMTGSDADFIVKLIDVFPDDAPCNPGEPVMSGYQMLVRAEVMRGRYRNSFEQPAPFRPGKVERVRFSMPDVAHTFRKGHRLMVQVQSTWFPLVSRNPQQFVDIYQAGPGQYRKAEIRLHHSADLPSRVILPLLSGGGGQ